MKKVSLAVLMIFMMMFVVAPAVQADTLTWANVTADYGTGFGNVSNVLTLQHNGTETGSVIPTSAATGDAANTSKTWTSAQLAALGFNASNLGIVWNISQTGSSPLLSLNQFSLDFYEGSTTLAASAQLDMTGGPFNVKGLGTGTSGWLITYNNTGLLTQFFANPTWVLGGTGSAGSPNASNDGPDSFYLVQIPQIPQIPQVPEPMSLLLLGFGLVGIAGIRRKMK
jgi:hypothetical protein